MRTKKKSRTILRLAERRAKFVLFIAVFAALGTLLIWRSFAAESFIAVSIAGTNTNKGYWIATAQGHVVAKGDAKALGSPIKQKLQLRQGITDIAALPSDDGYWVLGGDGGVFSYGQAQFYGTPTQVSTPGFYVAIVSTPSGKGYWVVSKIGTAFAFGDADTTYKVDFKKANYAVAYGGIVGVSAIVDADRSETGKGLYIQDENGKTYTTGDADHRGGIVEQLGQGEKATAIAAQNTSSYLIVSGKGKIQSRGTGTKNVGDMTGRTLHTRITGITKFGKAQDNNVGYWLLGENGNVFNFGAARDWGGITNDDIPPDNPPPGTAEKPDIIVIYTDDQRFDETSFMPNLNKYIKDLGVNFRNAFALNPICCPSRATLLTGGDSADTKVWNNYAPNGGYEVFKAQERDTIATRLKAKGYRTGLFGKYINQYNGADGKLPAVPPGWDVWRAFRGVNGDYYDYELVTGNGQKESHKNKINGQFDPRDYSTDVLGEHLTSYLRNSPTNKPLFALFTPYAPHVTPAVPPKHINSSVPAFEPRGAYNEEDVSDKPGYISKYEPKSRSPERPKRDTSVLSTYATRTRKTLLAVDDVIGDIVATQRARDRIENTVLIFASDNGYNWGEHRFVGKETPYEESIRIPLMVRFDPQTKKRASNEDKLVTNADIAATITAYAGTTPPKNAGKSLKPLVGRENVTNWRDRVDINHYPSQLSGTTDFSKSVPAWCGFRNERYKVVWNQPWSKKQGEPIRMPNPKVFEGELYDLREDGNERSNRFYDQRYRSILNELWPQLRSACNRPPTSMDKPPANPPVENASYKLDIKKCDQTSTLPKKSWVRSFFNRIGQIFTRKSPDKASVSTANLCTNESTPAEPQANED